MARRRNSAADIAKWWRTEPRRRRRRRRFRQLLRSGATIGWRAVVGLTIGVLAGLAILDIGAIRTRFFEPYVTGVSDSFGRCSAFRRDNCVIDGDTFRYQGDKIRIVGVDTPELFPPRCEAERIRGEEARARLVEWLNRGPFELSGRSADRRDRYGRLLFSVRRDGENVVEYLVEQGVGRRYLGDGRAGWC